MPARIAIVGLGCIFPGAPNLARFWSNIVDGVDAVSDVPEGRWASEHYDPQARSVDRFYCKRGGFVDDYADFDPLAFGVMPKAAASIEPDQLLTLRVGFDALRDSGYDTRSFPRDRTGVIVGRGNYLGAGVVRLEQHVRLLPQVLQTVHDLFPDLPADALEQVRERLQRQLTYYGPDVASGMIPNLIASRLANRLDLGGPAYTVDAACASALIALEQGCSLLAHHETDLMLIGGVHLCHDVTLWATFCQLGALSRSGTGMPLSADADGILAGEGVGMAVLKRFEDAEAAGDRIYAVIEGVGSSSDGRSASLVAPSVDGQVRALERAWARVGFSRDQVGLLEAHGTGTPTGDAAELETVARFFGAAASAAGRSVIGSVKSMIGHAMPASGMASLIKTALAIHHGVLPPTLHCQKPHPKLATTRFRTLSRSERWGVDRAERVAAVNAFGFGGINAHVVLRGHTPIAAGTAQSTGLPPVLLLAAETPQALLERLEHAGADGGPGEGSCRLAIVAPDAKKLEAARRVVAAGRPWQGRQQIWFSPGGLLGAGGGLAFVFPGVDGRFAPRCEGLTASLGIPLPAGCHEYDAASSLSRLVVALLGFNRFMFDCLGRLGIRGSAYAGHSVGEWSAMLCGGMLDQGLSDRTNAGLDFDAVRFPDVQFLAAACSEGRLQKELEGLPQIGLSHDNCPNQVLACGSRESVAKAADRLRKAGIFTQVLPFVSGFHSPLFAGHMDWYRAFFAAATLGQPNTPVWSATLAAPFPANPEDCRNVALDHLLQPVRFRELIERMYEQGHRVFVEVGTGSLCGFIDDTLSGKPHLALRANHESRGGLEQLQQVCAALWVEGGAFDMRLLETTPRENMVVKDDAVPHGSQKLALGVPLVRVLEPLEPSLRPQMPGTASLPDISGDDEVSRLLRDTLGDIERAGREALSLWRQFQPGRAPAAVPADQVACPSLPRSLRVRLDVATTIPWVADHELYRQRPGWPVSADRHPVVPMTMEVMLVREAVEEAFPGFKVVEVCDIRAHQWLAVAEPVTVDITLKQAGPQQIDAEIVGYFRAKVTVAEGYPADDIKPMAPLRHPRATDVPASDLYSEGWMFHGPAYQGVADFRAIGENGIDGCLTVPTGKGGLLDNMGQLAGYWVMEQPQDCLAMPIGVERIQFFGQDPRPGERLEAQVRIAHLDDQTCISDHQLRDAEGALRIAITGWSTRRYKMDKPLWVASRKLSSGSVSQLIPPDVAVFEDRYDTALMRDYLSRRYLAQPEQNAYAVMSPRKRRSWLAGRIAAKDAVRAWLRKHRHAQAVWPQEAVVLNDEAGVPHVQAHLTDSVPAGLHISLAHKTLPWGILSAAIVGDEPVGIDVEAIASRDAGFIELSFNPAELPFLSGADPAVELTRGWVAKEVAAKASRKGLGGNPRAFSIIGRDGDCLCVDGHWVVTHPLRECIIGWSLPGLGRVAASSLQDAVSA